jgi:hypothetical protein
MFKKSWATAFIVLHLIQLILPNSVLFGAHGNDSQGSPTGISNLVDLKTGDFSYSIPLISVEGYPLTLNYNAGVKLEQQASWVGLGWSLTPGAINRQMQGLPDDFKGDMVKTTFNQEENKTRGGGIELGAEVGGLGNIPFASAGLSGSIGANATFNNYTGFGLDRSVSLAASGMLKLSEAPLAANAGISLNRSVGNQSGVTQNLGVNVGLALAKKGPGDVSLRGGIGLGKSNNYNSVRGYNIESTSFSMSFGAYEKDGFGAQTTGAFTTTKFPSQAIAFTPTVPISKVSRSLAFKLSGGGEVYTVYPYAGVTYMESSDKLISNVIENPGYGQMYLGDIPAEKEPLALLDYNREAESVIRHETTVLPFSYKTEDYFSMSSSSGGLTFRTKRGDFGNYNSPIAIVEGNSDEHGLEFGVGGYAEAGTNYSESVTYGVNTKWNDSKLNLVPFAPTKRYNNPEEAYYFKAVGELTEATSYYQHFGLDEANAVHLETGGSHALTNFSENVNGEKKYWTTPVHFREQRQTVIHAIQAGKANLISPFPEIKNVTGYTTSGLQFTSINKENNTSLTSTKKPHHISDFHVIEPGGNRIYYSHPVYNRVKKEVVFNVEGNTYDISKGLVAYSQNDASINNTKGVDRFYHKKEVPDYAEQFLISGVFSKNYEDRTQDGPSLDDVGNYTLFNYTKEHDNYRWRMPYQKDQAFFDPSSRAITEDDKGSYVYGEKELWYLQSVESRNLIAEFVLNDKLTEPRKDGLGVLNENGGKDVNQRRRYLKEIRLYAKEDKLRNGSNAQPLKKIVFHYNYELCQGSPDSDAATEGKLTLKKLEFFDFESKESEGKYYEFGYDSNPKYVAGAKDRWGNYKPNYVPHHNINTDDFFGMSVHTNNENPYTSQDKVLADEYASAWNLNSIVTPSGSEVSIMYESDSYAYVQDKKPMRMFRVSGFKFDQSTAYSNKLYESLLANQLMVVDLEDEGIPVSSTNPDQEFVENYLTDNGERLESIYYNFYVQMAHGTGHYDVVNGYMNIDADGATVFGSPVNGYYKKALIPIKLESVPEGTFNPISRMAWQNAGDYLGKVVIPGSNLNGVTGYKAFVQALAGQQTQKRIHKQGFYRFMKSERNGIEFSSFRSFVRLYDGDGIKYGGGHRVSKITVTDHWEEFSDTYGTEYTYADTRSETPLTSGVNSNEPIIGGEDNTLFRNNNDLLSQFSSSYGRTNKSFIETPIGRNVLPGAQVVYSYVQQKSISKTNVTLSRTGDIINEFYTAKDFPIEYEFTPIQKYVEEVDPKVSWNRRRSQLNFTASQGFSVVMNDMHGKPKRTETRDENGNVISSIYYKYKTKDGKLNNEIKTLNSNNVYNTEIAGVETSVCLDTRENRIEVRSEQKQKNLNVIPPPPPVPIPVPLPIISWSKYKSKSVETLRTITLSKIIQKYGIIEEVVTYDERARFSAKDVIYDHESRQAIVSTATNYLDENSDLVNVSYPAYWNSEYKEFGPAYKNIGVTYHGNLVLSSGNVVKPELQVLGTECLVRNTVSNTYTKVWVSKNTSGVYKFIDKDGVHYNPTVPLYKLLIEVVRPGELNYSSASVQSFSMLEPTALALHEIHSANTIDNVVSGSASTFTEDALIEFNQYAFGSDCPGYTVSDGGQGTKNPFLEGVKGTWNVHKSFALNLKRNYNGGYGSQQPNSLNLESDGVVSVEPKYYHSQAGLVNSSTTNDWITTKESTRISALNGVIEFKDSQGNYATTVYANQGLASSGGAGLARKADLYFESFEDKNISNTSSNGCYTKRVQYSNGYWVERPNTSYPLANETPIAPSISYTEAHTGDGSMQLAPSSKVNLRVSNGSTYGHFEKPYNFPYEMWASNFDQGLAWTPQNSVDYTVSFWVKVQNQNSPYVLSTPLRIYKANSASHISINRYYESPILDGWKQITFLVPYSQLTSGTWYLEFNNAYGENMFIDDIKISPINSVFTASTITPMYGRIEAQLDQSNFSTQYIYNSKGIVSEIFRETSEGKVTISSTRSSTEQ